MADIVSQYLAKRVAGIKRLRNVLNSQKVLMA